MKILIFGGSGFIGSHVLDVAVTQGFQVRVFDRGRETFRQTPAGIEFIQGNFGDKAAMAEALSGVDIVLHLISTTVPSTANLNPIADIESNLVNTLKLLE